jgi:TPR repeat protein
MNFARSMFLTVVLSFSSGSVATAQDFDKGFAAYDVGDFVTALEEWRPLAEQGDARAQSNLGWMYSNGQGVLQDYAEAVKWSRLAAEQGYATGQNNLGLMYNDGEGVSQNHGEAVRWYRLAAEQGYAKGQTNLGVMFVLGRGVLQDKVRAHMWFNIAAANGNADGVRAREMIVDEMSPADISQAQAMARECMSSDYADCGW